MKALYLLPAALLATLLLSSCATGTYVDPEPQRQANQRLQENQTRRALKHL